MLRRPLTLAALANSAVHRLRPTSVQGTATGPDDRFQIAFLTDGDGSEWVVRVGLTTAAGAQMEASRALLKLLAKRLPYAVPHIEGTTVTADGDTVAVMPRLPGTALVWRELEPGSALARSIGQAVATLHDIDPRVVEEAGLPTYDADAYRARRLATLDRAAATGLVPTGLLARWERALEEVTLWKFATCTVHGPLQGSQVLIDDASAITAITGWEAAGVSDPAEDFAVLSVLADPAAFDTVLESYAAARRDSPDIHLERRVRLAAELQRVNALMNAVAADDKERVQRRTAALRRLDAATQDDHSLMPPTPGRRRPAAVEDDSAGQVDPRDIKVVELSESNEDDETVEIPISRPAPRPQSSKGAAASAGTANATNGVPPAGDESDTLPESSTYPIDDDSTT
ncbi:phosphotransferase [Rudaeicoccus suwonensis]|uniref:phosphotransferase n=1 Tax=Rudaeicoccus suwonensis TaxID=657409 RepID=UPI00147776AB|nr:phosphotransferase [Rudaeicoccus suwonensis]